MNLGNVKSWSISQGLVKKVVSGGVTLWEKMSYINRVKTSIDTDGSIYNGTGYIGRKRLSSSGVLKDADYASATGYISASSGAIVRIKGVDWNNTSYCYVCAYNASFGFISAVNSNGEYGGGTVSRNGDLATVTLNNNSNIAYVRVSAVHSSADAGYTSVAKPIEGPGSYLIVTINQEITD